MHFLSEDTTIAMLSQLLVAVILLPILSSIYGAASDDDTVVSLSPDGISATMHRVVFFGRTAEESLSMFNLSYETLQGKRVLDCPGGPSSFIARAAEQGIESVAVDPIYEYSSSEEVRGIGAQDISLAIKKKQQGANWVDVEGSDFSSLQQMSDRRFEALDVFAADFELGKQQGRYIPAALPNLPFADDSFDISLTGNFLFAYAPVADGGVGENDGAFDLDWHRAAVRELLRVTKEEIRIFPAHNMVAKNCERHPYAVALAEELQQEEQFTVSFYETSYRQGQEGEVVGLQIRKKVVPTLSPNSQLDRVVFFGRTADEYRRIFELEVETLAGKRVLDCPGGPSSFTARAVRIGADAVAVDPMYANSPDDVKSIGMQDVKEILSNKAITSQMMDVDGSEFSSLEQIEGTRIGSLKEFVDDFSAAAESGRYVAAALPVLPFPDSYFDLVLSAHLLFAYSPAAVGGAGTGNGAFDLNFHRAAIAELLRVSKDEVRIYPAHTMGAYNCTKHQYALTIAEELTASGDIDVSFYESSYRQGQNGDIVGIRLVKKSRSEKS